MRFITKKWQKLIDYLICLEIKYDDEIHNRDLAIHQHIMNMHFNDKKNKKTYEDAERKCIEDKHLFEQRIEVIKNIRIFVSKL